jgi:predicted nucleic acid-binding protein
VTITLLDTGPMVAALNPRDRHHGWALELLRNASPPLLTCEAVLSEAVFLLQHVPNGPQKALELVQREVVAPVFRLATEAAAVGTLLARYHQVPIDLADACLVRMTELHPDCVLWTIDSEFRDIYRRNGRRMIPLLLPS